MWATTGAFAALPLWLAIDGGGYDLILRQEVGVAAWWLLALGIAFGVLPRAQPSRDLRIAGAGLAALIAITALGLLGTESAGRTFAELGRLLAYGGLIALAALALRPDLWRAAAAGLAVAALLVPALALASRLGPELFDGLAPPELLGGSRLAYPLGYWNAVASWCAIAFAIGLSASAHARRTELRSLALAALPMAGVALYLTYSRAGWVSLALGLAVVLAAGRHRATVAVHGAAALAATGAVVLIVRTQPAIADGNGAEGGWVVAAALVVACIGCARLARITRRSRLDRVHARPVIPRLPRAAGIAAVAVTLMVALVLGPSLAGTAGDEFEGGYPELDDDPAGRLVHLGGSRGELWGSALGAFGSSPVTGIGAGSFQFWWERDVAEGEAVRDAHSLYLETLAETGAPGLVALLVLLGWMLVAAIRSHRTAATPGAAGASAGLLAAYSVFVVHAGIDWTWDFPALAVLGLGGAGVLAAAQARPVRGRRHLSLGRVAIVTLAVAAGAAEIPGIVTANRARAAEEVFLAGLPDRAVELAGDAVAAEPWAAEPYALRAYVELYRQDPDAARTDALDAIEREPTNWRHRLLLARVETKAGDPVAANAALDAVVDLRPATAPDVDRLRARIEAGVASPASSLAPLPGSR
ncbi:MAG: O-antigen ligase family protein [Solirubrobacterales bacterium]